MRLTPALLLIIVAISASINAENKHQATEDPDLDLDGVLIDDATTTNNNNPPADSIAFTSALQLQPPRPVITSASNKNTTTTPTPTTTTPISNNNSNQTTTSTGVTQFIPTQTAIPPRNPYNSAAAQPKHIPSTHTLLVVLSIALGYTVGIGH